MLSKRRHERLSLLADLVIQPGEENPACFAGRVFNLSANGAAVFSQSYFPAGKLVSMELMLPVSGQGVRRVVLYGVIRHVVPREDGNVLGIEIQTGREAGDYPWFLRYLQQRTRQPAVPPGFTLTEACITLTIICLLITLAVPIYIQAMEQARVDTAGGVLRSIWSAQRIYWLEYRTFAPDLEALNSLDLLNASVADSYANPAAPFVYRIASADAGAFTAEALRNGTSVWTGQLSITEAGQVAGSVAGRGITLTPPS
jgi:type II secretory pathway pseudopilin PulG